MKALLCFWFKALLPLDVGRSKQAVGEQYQAVGEQYQRVIRCVTGCSRRCVVSSPCRPGATTSNTKVLPLLQW